MFFWHQACCKCIQSNCFSIFRIAISISVCDSKIRWGKIEKEKVINLIKVFITQNLMIWKTREENHDTISGSCAWKTRSHFSVENTELENWKLESVTKFRFPRPILSFPVFPFSSFSLLRHQLFKLENWKSVNSPLKGH